MKRVADSLAGRAIYLELPPFCPAEWAQRKDALAPLDRAWAVAEPLLRPGGRLLHFSGPLAGSPSPPPRASEVQVVAEFLIDSPGPIVIIRRQ